MFAHALVGPAPSRPLRGTVRNGALGVAGTLTLLFATSSVAQAQCVFGGPNRSTGGERLYNFAASASTAVTSAVTAMNTAFQTQTSAFIASPSGPEPNQFAGGVWMRGVGGRVDIDSAVSGIRTTSDRPSQFETVSCAIQTRNDFTGVQGGVDIGRINLGSSGWNVHLGVTAGYFEAEVRTQGAGLTRAEVPFVGLYAALVGANGFFLDAQARADFLRIGISEPSIGAGGATDATGFSFTSSAGYGWVLGNYVIEPSVAILYSNTRIDPLSVNPAIVARNGRPITIPTNLTLNDVESLLGRAGVRVGASYVAGNVSLQPFVAASVWHEFAGDTSAGATTTQPNRTAILSFNSSRVGTFGQYSIGVAASVPNTGWLGYARFDYRNGENIEGYSVNGGLRYQFAPAPQVAATGSPRMPTKAPAVGAIDSWGGFYLGGFVGGAWAGNVRATEIAAGPGDFTAYNGLGTTASYNLDSSVIGGLTLGYNHQMGLIVAGVEAEGGYLRLTGSAPFVASPGRDTVSSTKIGDWYALLAARLGVAVGPALIYGKGGAAFLSITSGVLDSCFTAPCGVGIVTATGGNPVEVTWTVGGGLEFALSDRWSVKGEYLYLDGTSYTASGPGFVGPGGFRPQQFNWRHEVPGIHTAKLGINYRFGSSSSVVIARN